MLKISLKVSEIKINHCLQFFNFRYKTLAW